MSVSRRLRFEVLRRDGHTCRYCGKTAEDTELTVDHVVPVALGGADEPSNLVTACQECNAGKAAISPDQEIVENVSDDALRWSAAMERAAEIRAKQRKERDAFIDPIDEAWRDWKDGAGEEIPRPGNWRQSLSAFFDAGLEREVAIELIQVAMAKPGLYNMKTWRYYCGCCWNAIREQQAIARSLVEYEEQRSRDEAGRG